MPPNMNRVVSHSCKNVGCVGFFKLPWSNSVSIQLMARLRLAMAFFDVALLMYKCA